MHAQSVVYEPHGECCWRISEEIRDNRQHNVRFADGCYGNGQGLTRLLEGMATEETNER